MIQKPKDIQASILDRLVDNEPAVSHEPVQHRLFSIGQIKTSIIRDLENLLNTRRQILLPPVAYKEVNNSLYVYGLSDFTSQNPKSLSVKQQLRLDIENTISRFEPRLKNVNIEIEIEKSRADKSSIWFRITGLLVVEPIKEPVTFDTYFDINRGKYIISK